MKMADGPKGPLVMNAQLFPAGRSTLSVLLFLMIPSVAVLSSCEVPQDPFKDGQEQKVHDQGMYPDKNLPDTTAMDRMDTATNPTMDGKP